MEISISVVLGKQNNQQRKPLNGGGLPSLSLSPQYLTSAKKFNYINYSKDKILCYFISERMNTAVKEKIKRQEEDENIE